MVSWFVNLIPELEKELNQAKEAADFLQTTLTEYLEQSKTYNANQVLETQQAVIKTNGLELVRPLPLFIQSAKPALVPMLLPAEHSGVTIALKNLLRESTQPLNSAQLRSMVAMVQASGSGKTKLAHTLADEPSGPIVVFSVVQISTANGELINGTPWRLAQDLLERVRGYRDCLHSNDTNYNEAFRLAAKVGKQIIEMTILAHFDAALEFLHHFKSQPTARRDLVLRLNSGGAKLVTYFLRRRIIDFLNCAKTAKSVSEVRPQHSFSHQLEELASKLRSLAEPKADIPLLFVLDEMPILHKRVRRLFFHVKSGLNITNTEILEQQKEDDRTELKPDMLYITQLIFADMVQLEVPVLGIGTDHVLLETLANDSSKFSPNQFCRVRPFRELCPFSVADLVRMFSSYFKTNLSQVQLQELLQPLQGRPLFFSHFLSDFVPCISQLDTKSVEDLIKKSVNAAVQRNVGNIRDRLKNGSQSIRYDNFHDIDVQATFSVAIQGGIMRSLNDEKRNSSVAAGLAMLADPNTSSLDLRQEPIVHEALWRWGIEATPEDDPVIKHIQRMLSPHKSGHDGDVFEFTLLRAFQRSWQGANDKSLLNVLLSFVGDEPKEILNDDVIALLASISCSTIGPVYFATKEKPMASDMLFKLSTNAVLFCPPSTETGPDVVLLPCPGVAVVVQCKSGGSTLLEALGTLSPSLFGTSNKYKMETLLGRSAPTRYEEVVATLRRLGIADATIQAMVSTAGLPSNPALATAQPTEKPPSKFREDWALLGIHTVIRAVAHPSPFNDDIKTYVKNHNHTDPNTPILLFNLPELLVGPQLSAPSQKRLTIGQGTSGTLPLNALRFIDLP